MIAFAKALRRMGRRVDRDLAHPGLPREKVLAAVVRLLETTRMRVGNEEYARENASFGLTTLRERQVQVHGAGSTSASAARAAYSTTSQRDRPVPFASRGEAPYRAGHRSGGEATGQVR